MLKIGIVRETKVPMDIRVPLSPKHCHRLLEQYNTNQSKPILSISVESCTNRCFKNDEYEENGIKISNELSHCDVLLGVKEVNKANLLPNKTYFMFSHTIKKQPYNRALLQEILEKNIRLIDYELLMNETGIRMVSFSRWAGIVGTHNALYSWGCRTGQFKLPRLHETIDLAHVTDNHYKHLQLPSIKIILTGDGRVATGCTEILDSLNMKKVTIEEFITTNDFGEAVYCQLSAGEMYARQDGHEFDDNFFQDPSGYYSIFTKFLTTADMIINGIYWDRRTPPLFTLSDLKSCKDALRIRVIADISCDIAPHSSIPCTLRPSTIAQPIYGFNLTTELEDQPHGIDVIDVMAVDNLPNELPRDASYDFGEMFTNQIIPQLINEMIYGKKSEMLNNATIAENGKLTRNFAYLQDYVDGID